MTHFARIAAFLALAFATACTSPERFDDTAGGEFSDTGIEGGTLDGVGDPGSVAYFNQTVGDRVLFTVDEATLNDGAIQTLRGQATWLMDNPEYTAVIEGHADEQGTREYNLALGARRASAVQQYLIAQGVAPNRLRTVTYGKERPIEICSEEACYSKNRRAVTVLSAAVAG